MAAINNSQKSINNSELPSFIIDENSNNSKILIKNSWSGELLISLCQNYDLQHAKISQNIIMIKVSNQFFQNVFWPEFLALNKYLQGSFSILTNRLTNKIDKAFENQEDFF